MPIPVAGATGLLGHAGIITLIRASWHPDPGATVVDGTGSGQLVGLCADWLPEFIIDDDDGTVYELLDSVCAQADASASLLMHPAEAFDPQTAPSASLPLLAAIAGVDLTGVAPEAIRARIADPRWRTRGSPEVLAERIRTTLTGGQHVTVEVHGDHLQIHTFTSETPDPDLTKRVAAREAPAWLRVSVSTTAGMTYAELAAKYPTYGDLRRTGKTYAELTREAP